MHLVTDQMGKYAPGNGMLYQNRKSAKHPNSEFNQVLFVNTPLALRYFNKDVLGSIVMQNSSI
jgi:hypothetical protein